MWKVIISKVQGLPFIPFIPVIVFPLNATEHACVWSACIAVFAFGAKKREPEVNIELSQSAEYFAQTAENNFDQNSLLLLLSFFLFLFFFFFYLSQLYFSQCEIQRDSHPRCVLSGNDEMRFGC